MRILYACVFGFIGAFVDLAINLLAGVIQQKSPSLLLGQHGIGLLIALIILGILLGVWFGTTVRLQPCINSTPPAQPTHQEIAYPIALTRFRALLSYGRLRGQGIALADILLIGSVLDIDSRK